VYGAGMSNAENPIRNVEPLVPADVRSAVLGWLRMDAAEPARNGRRAVPAGSDPAAIGLVADREFAVYLALPRDQREEIEKRLFAFWNQRNSTRPESMSAVAEKASTGRANAYRIIQRMSVLGPIRGLVPQYRAGQRASGTRDGFGEPVDRWIEEALLASTSATIADVERHLDVRGAQPAHRDVVLPTPSALKRRVQHLRRSSSARVVMEPLGKKVLIDFCRVDVIDLSRQEEDLWTTAIVDIGTGVILGLGVQVGEGDAGLIAALSDMRRRLPDLARHVRIAARIENFEWVVSPLLIARAEKAGAELRASRRPRIDILPGGERQFGVRLVRVIGDRLGDRRLLTRGRAAPFYEDDAHKIRGFTTGQEAAYALEVEANSRNAALLGPVVPIGSRGHKASLQAADALMSDMVEIIGPVVLG